MIDYLASFTNTDGAAFPNTLGINATGAGAGDGTEFVKLYVDDAWGSRQALMDAAGLTPDSVTEAVDTSQLLEAIRIISGAPGNGVIWWATSDPAVLGERVLLLTGQTILMASYPELALAVYVGDGNNATASAFYKTSDTPGTIRDTGGAYMVFPDSRGYALRGLDVAAAVDPDGASRDIGSIQLDAMQQITGSIGNTGIFSASPTTTGVFTSTFAASNQITTGSSGERQKIDFDSADSISPNVAKTDAIESRMINIACNIGIRY